MTENQPVFIVGDVHGYFDKLTQILIDAGLVNPYLSWSGRDAQLWFLGDFTDRGADGIGVLDFVMRLQFEAEDAGGRVSALLGNHDVALLAAALMPDGKTSGAAGTFRGDWERYGGMPLDLARLTPRHVEWVQSLPTLAVVENRLLVHADALYYERYGDTLEEVNSTTSLIIQGNDTTAWDRLLAASGERRVFEGKPEGVTRARAFLQKYGGKQIVHGHTPINTVTHAPAEKVNRALVYAEGLCVNVDGGMYKGGPGLVYRLPALVTDGALVEQPAFVVPAE